MTSCFRRCARRRYAGNPDVTWPHESFVDPAHTPAGLDEVVLATLQKVFPGL